MRIIADSRERNGNLLDLLVRRGVEVSAIQLPVGDYVISDRICIERKTISDFESSIMDGRLFDQAKRMKGVYPSPMLLLEGMHSDFRMGDNVIVGAIAHLYVDAGIQVLLSAGPEESALLIESVARQEQAQGAREPSAKGGARLYTDREYEEAIVANLPGVGPKTARRLLEHFGSIRGIVGATEKELTGVEKIGKKKAERIRRIIDDRYLAGRDNPTP